MKTHYDIGLYGWWGHENFGGIITYFALERTLKKLGYSVLMIQEATGLPKRYKIPSHSIAMKFAKGHYDCSPQVDILEMDKFNDICDAFIAGGDQLWNDKISFSKEDHYLSFVDSNKLKVSYSTSFGSENYSPSQKYHDVVEPLLKRFDAISVRENYAVNIAKDVYGVDAVQAIDAVFLLDRSEYQEILDETVLDLPDKYLLAYIMDPTEAKRSQVDAIAEKLKLDVVCIPDAAAAKRKQFNEIFAGVKKLPELTVENFLKAYDRASYVVTDSFHGTCFSYIFKKDFSVYYNASRGSGRFASLMEILQLDSRKILESADIKNLMENPNIDYNVDWTVANNNVSYQREKAIGWLKSQLSRIRTGLPREKNEFHRYIDLIEIEKEIKELESVPDFVKIRLLATLLRDYGVKHIVLSPGGRDVPLIRMFEYNDSIFHLHHVTDERSAAYFGLGLAAQSRKPVACVCTSGTAASNYLPAVTEAYYTHIPLILITADRREIYLNNGEDQTIPQKEIYKGVTKMEISLPESWGQLTNLQIRRDISNCILESTHDVPGPVHINISIGKITFGEKKSRYAWRLLPFIHPHILRASLKNGTERMLEWVNALKKSEKILLVYGQNYPLDTTQLEHIECFVKKFNCVVLTDTISNLSCSYAIEPFIMLNSMDQDTFDKELAPDILITVGGKRLMNDPLTNKVRGSKLNIRHWSVTPDGIIRDMYHKLTSVIECEQDFFFRFFSENAGDISNKGLYYESWRSFDEQCVRLVPQSFNSIYVQSKLLPAIPSNSVLHLGVGQSFFYCRRYRLQDSVEVFCNMGTNGIDGCTSTFMGQCAIEKERLCILLVGDLSFFYDMNSIWNKVLGGNVRILMVNNNGSGLLRGHNLRAVTSEHNTSAEGWVRSTGFEYMSARNPDELDKMLKRFLDPDVKAPLFLEVFCK